MVEKIQSDAEYNFYILGQHKQGKVTSTFGRKKLNINEISTATILARYKHENKVMETVIPKVPLFLWDAFNCLNTSGSLNNEIFRKSGSTKRITDFFNQNPTIFARGSNFDGLNHLDIGTLMKDFLRERQEPLFTSGDQLLHELELLTKRRVGIQFDTDQYPEFSTLLFILKVLHWMCLKDESGRMTPTNMAVYFNPIFIHNQLKESRDLKKGKGNNYEKKDTGKMAEMQKDRVQRDITILAALISQSQHLVVKSGLAGRYRSNSITPGVSVRDDDGRRSSSVIGRLMKYVGKDKVPKVTAIPLSFLVSKEFTPEGRQSRPRTRRTPNSAKSTSVRTLVDRQISQASLPSTPVTSQDIHIRPHFTNKSSEKVPRMRDEERVKDLMEARKHLDFAEIEVATNLEGQPEPNEKSTPLNELLSSLQESVEKLNSTPVPKSPEDTSVTFMKSPSPVGVTKCASPEVVVQDLIDSLCEEEHELSNICEEIEASNTVIESFRKEVKDQGCSPFRFSPKALSPEFKIPTLREPPPPVDRHSPMKKAKSPPRIVASPSKVPASPLSCRTASGGWDWKAHVLHSSTREELDAHFKENFPTHRPSIAMLTTYKRVTTNVARLEKNREEEKEVTARTSLSRGRESLSRRVSSGSKSFTKESEGPFLPKSKSAGSAPTGLPIRPLGDKSSSQNVFAVPRFPSMRNKYSRKSEDHGSHSHTCRQFKDPNVPSYAASTFSSAQHSILRPIPDALSSADFHRGPSSVVSPRRKSHGAHIPFSTAQERAETALPTLDDLTSLISKMSVSSLHSSNSEKENN